MILSIVFAVATGSPFGVKKSGPEIFVRTDRSVTVERLAAAVRPIGLVESRERGTRCYLIQLNAGVDSELAKQRLEKIPGVRALEAQEEPVDMSSMRSIDRKIAHLKVDEAEKAGKGSDGDLGYLESYRRIVGLRAFPNDFYDWRQLDKAKQHAHQMPPTVLLGTNPNADIASPGQYWQFLGPTHLAAPSQLFEFGKGMISGRVNAVAFDPTTSTTIYAGAARGGLWKSTNAGANWTWLSSSWTQLDVNCIVVDPVHPNIIYVGLGDYHWGAGGSYGIMKSTDGGQTWNEILTSFAGNYGCCSILMDPTNDQVLLAGTGDPGGNNSNWVSSGIWYSSDAGANWKQVVVPIFGDVSPIFPTIASSLPSNGKVRFYAIEGGDALSTLGTGRLLASDDHGQSWNFLASPVIGGSGFHKAYEIATSPTNSNNVYILDSEHLELFSSTNQGASWNNLGPYLPLGPTEGKTKDFNVYQSAYDFHLECGNRVNGTSNSDVLYLGEVDLQESLDQGHSWESLGGPVWGNAVTHGDQHCLAVCPTNPNLTIFSNDGGVYQNIYNPASGANTVTSLNATLGNILFFQIACNPTDPLKIMGAAQDNAAPFMSGSTGKWATAGGGDGNSCAINQSNPLIAYAALDGIGGITRTSDFWVTSTNIPPTVPKAELNHISGPPIALDPNNQNLMYTGTNYLYQWNDSTQTWTGDLGGVDLTNGWAINAIAVAPGDSNRIYVGSSDGKLSFSPNQGQNWYTMVSSPWAPITSISVNPNDENDFVVGYSGFNEFTGYQGYGQHHLFRYKLTPFGGSFSEQYFDVTGSGTTSLPDASLNAIARDLDDPINTWYVATDVGIFQTTDAGASWTNTSYAYGLPDVAVFDLVAVPGTRMLNAGTYGLGLWSLYMPLNGANLNGLTLTPSPVTGGNSVTGTVTLTRAAGNGGVVVNLSVTAGAADCPSSVTVPASKTSATFSVTPHPVTVDSTVEISATQSSITLHSDLQVLAPTLSPLNLGTSAVLGGVSLKCAVNLTGNAATDLTVNLSSTSTDVSVPQTVTIKAGSSAGYFTVQTTAVSSTVNATVTAALQGGNTQTVSLEVEPPVLTGLSVSPVLVAGSSQTAVVGTLTFDGATPAGGVVVKLFSSNTAAATVPATVTVKLANNATTSSFLITTKKVTSAQAVTIQAEYPNGTWQTYNIAVLPFLVTSISATPANVNGGSDSSGTVQINGAPSSASGSVIVKLTSSSRDASVPTEVVIPVGKTSQNFNISTKAVSSNTTATITAALNGGNQTTTVTVQPPTVVSLIISPTSVTNAGTIVRGTVTLSGPTPAGGTVVTLTSSANYYASAPKTVTVAAGQHTVSFYITHKRVSSTITATITASIGSSSASGTLTLKN